MHRLQVGGLPLPEVYVARTRSEAATLRDAGIPYIKTQMPDIDIVKAILFRILAKRFPHIKWAKVLGINTVRRINVIVPGGDVEHGEPDGGGPKPGTETSEELPECADKGHEVSDIAEDYRTFSNHGHDDPGDRYVPVDEYCFDEASHVNIETLQSLGFLPKFMDDAADAIRINLEDRMRWRECWNKRLGAAVGDVGYGFDAANLIILDISGSIPEGISATMLELIDSLRMQTNAELIITGSHSMYWSDGEELPEPRWIRSHIGYGNESGEFFKILSEHVAGRHFGNVISFGDNDSPNYDWKTFNRSNPVETPPLHGTRVDRVMHYHTTYQKETGYARWVKEVSPDAEQVIDTSWCEVMI